MSLKPLWRCPECGHQFTQANTWHSCGNNSLDSLFARKSLDVRLAYDALEQLILTLGTVTVIPQKTRIAFQARMRFAAVTPQSTALKGHLVLAEPRPLPCFTRVETLSRRNHLHHFRLTSPADIGADLTACVRDAYRVGLQEHLMPDGKA